MGDTTCVMPPFSYTSGTPNETHQGNPLHALGDSVSFGRFMTESLSWEKWSSFSQNRHVEEAERYAQPGSVAEKKAFFEAHYKRIAAAKKAAALLEQENAAKNTTESEFGYSDRNDASHDSETTSRRSPEQVFSKIKNNKENFASSADERNLDSDAKPEELELENAGECELGTGPKVLGEIAINIGSSDQAQNVEDKNMVSGLENPFQKDVSQLDRKKRPVLSSLKSSVFRKVSSTPAKPMLLPLHPRKENISTPSTTRSTIESTDKKRLTPKSFRRFINFTPSRGPDKLPTPASKDCATPLRTPAMASSVSGMPRHPSATPLAKSKGENEVLDPVAVGSKTSNPKWNLLSSVCSKSLTACRKKLQSSTLSTPFTLRTEERAARRKQKLEDRFNEKEAQKVQMQANLKKKADREAGKFGPSLCFRARPLPAFYREREKSTKQAKEDLDSHPQPPKQGATKPSGSSVQGTNPFTKSSTNSFKNLLKKNTQSRVSKFPRTQH